MSTKTKSTKETAKQRRARHRKALYGCDNLHDEHKKCRFRDNEVDLRDYLADHFRDGSFTDRLLWALANLAREVEKDPTAPLDHHDARRLRWLADRLQGLGDDMYVMLRSGSDPKELEQDRGEED